MTPSIPALPLRQSLVAALFLLPGMALHAQAPVVQDGNQRLRQEWLDGALGREDSRGPGLDSFALGAFGTAQPGDLRTPLLGGSGLGTALAGQGLSFRSHWVKGPFEIECTVLGIRDRPLHSARSVLHTGSFAYRSQGGLRIALEQTPFQWGYGLTGGYLLGDAHRPFPRISLETPYKAVRFFRVPLGSWRLQTFWGRLEWDRQLPDWLGNLERSRQHQVTHGDIRRPELSGFRLQAHFGPHIDLNLGATSMWGGVDLSGRRISEGYSFKDYLLSYFGAQNLIETEASGTPGQPTGQSRSRANGLACVEARVRFPAAARALGARGMAAHWSRGAESVNWQWKDTLKNPFSALWHDLKHDVKGWKRPLGTGYEENLGWNRREAAPSLDPVNDILGLQIVWETWDLGIEYADTRCNPLDGDGYRTYSHWEYLAGHSREGDSLGMAFGGEVITRTLVLGHPLPFGGRGILRVVDGCSAFRDQEKAWRTAHPGVDPVNNRFRQFQWDAQWALDQRGLTRAGFSVAHHSQAAHQFVAGNNRAGWTVTAGISRAFRP